METAVPPVWPSSASSSGHLHLRLVAFDLSAVQLRNDAVGVFGSHVDEQVPLPDVHRADCLPGQPRLAENRAYDVAFRNAHLLAHVDVKTCLLIWRPAAHWSRQDRARPGTPWGFRLGGRGFWVRGFGRARTFLHRRARDNGRPRGLRRSLPPGRGLVTVAGRSA